MTNQYNEEMDIYFLEEYGKLYEKAEKGVCEKYVFESSIGRIENLFIRRIIPDIVDGIQYFDIITPYGYGGPRIVKCDEGRREDLVQDYFKDFFDYCKKNKIVSEFIRFHPIINNAKDFFQVYKPEFNRKTVGISLLYDDPVKTEFSKSRRKQIGKSLRAGVTCQVNEQSKNLEIFKKIYYETMDRNNAKEYYYFDDEYFDQCSKLLKSHFLVAEAKYEGVTIAVGLYFIYGKFMHAHLSGTLNDYLHLSPAGVIKHALTLWGKENGYELIHQGAGVSTSSDDPLFFFKKSFGANTEFDFYISKYVWNKEVYEKLCIIKGIANGAKGFFPAYRS